MAVTKVHPVEVILEAYAAGHRLFGENRVQEFQEKSQHLTALNDAKFHLIGPLQSNKTAQRRRVVPRNRRGRLAEDRPAARTQPPKH